MSGFLDWLEKLSPEGVIIRSRRNAKVIKSANSSELKENRFQKNDTSQTRVFQPKWRAQQTRKKAIIMRRKTYGK